MRVKNPWEVLKMSVKSVFCRRTKMRNMVALLSRQLLGFTLHAQKNNNEFLQTQDPGSFKCWLRNNLLYSPMLSQQTNGDVLFIAAEGLLHLIDEQIFLHFTSKAIKLVTCNFIPVGLYISPKQKHQCNDPQNWNRLRAKISSRDRNTRVWWSIR